MGKNILILEGSPRPNGNSDMLAEQICKDSQIERLPGTISASQVADTNMITLNATASSAEEALRLLKSALESYPTLTGYFESGYMFRNLTALSADNIQKQTAGYRPDVIEILPGLMPRVIERIKKSVRCQVIAGGLISEKEDIVAALKAGAVAISTTDKNVWKM